VVVAPKAAVLEVMGCDHTFTAWTFTAKKIALELVLATVTAHPPANNKSTEENTKTPDPVER